MRIQEILLEYNRSSLRYSIGDKLLQAAHNDKNKNYHQIYDVNQILVKLEEMDPTIMKTYVPWLAQEYINAQFSLDDTHRIQNVLHKFLQTKNKNSNIESYSLIDLENELKNIEIVNFNKNATAVNDSDSDDDLQLNKHYTGKESPQEIMADFKKNELTTIQNIKTYLKKTGKKRWLEMEPFILKYPGAATEYAKEILKPLGFDRWRLAEPEILKDPSNAYTYAKEILGKRWPAAEKVIFDNVMRNEYEKKRYPDEPKNDSEPTTLAIFYAIYVMKERWPELEPYMAENAYHAGSYAARLLKRPWPEAEATISKNVDIVTGEGDEFGAEYAEFVKDYYKNNPWKIPKWIKKAYSYMFEPGFKNEYYFPGEN